MNKKIKVAFDQLTSEGFFPQIITTENLNHQYYTIKWENNKCQYEIGEFDIAWDGKNIAWVLDEEPRLIIYKNETQETLKLLEESHNFYLLHLEWYKGFLILIYKGKHKVFIGSYQNKELKYFSFHGEDINRKGHLISYDTYINKLEGKIRLIKIPELIEVEPISNNEAKDKGLIPQDLQKMMFNLGDNPI